jgi:hypothetical protein
MMVKKLASLLIATGFLLICSASVVSAEVPSTSKEALKSQQVPSKQLQPLKLPKIPKSRLSIAGNCPRSAYNWDWHFSGGLTVDTSGFEYMTLTWHNLPQAESIIIERKEKGAGSFKQIAVLDGSVQSYVDYDFPYGRFYYRLKAFKSSGCFEYVYSKCVFSGGRVFDFCDCINCDQIKEKMLEELEKE